MAARRVGSVYQKPRGTGPWYVRYKKISRRTTATSEAAALKELARFIVELDGGGARPRARHGGGGVTTFAQVWQLLVAYYVRKERKSLRMLPIRHNHLEPFFRDIPAHAIDANIEAYRSSREAERASGRKASNASINREVAALRLALRLAGFGVTRIEKLTEYIRPNWLEAETADAIGGAMPEHYRRVPRMAYLTGWRREEFLSRQWRHLDADGRFRLDVGETKNLDGRTASLEYPELEELLAEQRAYVKTVERRHDIIVPWIFCGPTGKRLGDFYGVWRRACKAVGVPGAWLHDYRRTAARDVDACPDVPRTVAMALLGHKTESIFLRYVGKPRFGEIQAAGRSLSTFRRERAAKTAASNVVPLRTVVR